MEQINNRFMLDTNVLNKLCDSDDDFRSVMNSCRNGTECFLTETQYEEVRNSLIPNKLISAKLDSIEINRAKRAISLMEIVARIPIKYTPRYATLFEGGWPLDGSCDILPDSEATSWPMFLDIYNENQEHYNDAMIALVSISNGCNLVTNDRRLRNKVNAHFAGRSIIYEEFIALISS